MSKKTTLFEHLNYKQAMEFYQEQNKSKNSWYVKILIFIATTLILTFFLSVHYDINVDKSPEFRTVPGYMWTSQKVVANFTYPIYKNYDNYRNEQEAARDNALMVFTFNESAKINCSEHLDLLYKAMKSFCTDSIENAESILPQSVYANLQLIPKSICEREIKKIYLNLKIYINKIYANGFVSENKSSITQNEISVQLPPNREKIYKTAFLTDMSTIRSSSKKFLGKRLSKKALPLAIEIASTFNFPNFIFSKKLTEKSKDLAAMSVARYEGIVRKGETLISKGEIVTEATVKKLISYNKSKLIKNADIYSFRTLLGSFGHSILIYFVLISYLFFIRKRIFADNFQLVIISLILILVGFMAWLTITIPTSLPIEFLIFLPALSMLAAIVFDSRTAFYVTITMALIVSGIRGNDYSTGLILLVSGIIAAYTVRDIQSRTQMFQSILFIFIGLGFGITVMGLERSATLSNVLSPVFFAGMNALLSPLLTFGLLLFLERYTNITTDLRLLEYDKQNHPLLHQLSEIAPGTYQHTLSVSMLAERCSTEINANPILAKVGALYHDIGKLAKPEYFVENQLDIENKLDQLSPQKSVETIKQHVLEGIKLAHEFNLPQRIIDFIPTHHGTYLIKHFYAKALEEAEDKSTINENDFRYPGPKPFSKETAIVMICDFSEAISRLIGKNKEELIKAIESNIRDRLIDGQFDECNITLKDLDVIKNTCVKVLIGASHKRVQYKEIPNGIADNKK